jgi:type IV secretion system protein VirD4
MDSQTMGICFWLVLLFLFLYHRKRRSTLSTSAHGTASWCSEAGLKAAGMLSGKGLVLGRTASGALIWLRVYTHLLLVGGTGSGKGVGFVIPNALIYSAGSLAPNDCWGCNA